MVLGERRSHRFMVVPVVWFFPEVLNCLYVSKTQKLDPSKNTVLAHGFDRRDRTKMLRILPRERLGTTRYKLNRKGKLGGN